MRKQRYVGVTKVGNKWRAIMQVKGKHVHLGYFNRVCLGFVALTFIFVDFDVLIEDLLQEGEYG